MYYRSQKCFLISKTNKQSRKYFRFIFNRLLYQFTSLPFGPFLSPLIFTKIIKPVTSYLRSRGYRSNIYLDDALLYGISYEDCIKNMQITINFLQSLGFVVNFEKSNLIPSQKQKYLGFIIDSNKFIVKLPDVKKRSLLKRLNSFKDNKSYTIREFYQLQGLLVSALPGIDYGMLYTKNLEVDKSHALKLSKGNFEENMIISKNTIADLNWWKANLINSYRLIKEYNFKL